MKIKKNLLKFKGDTHNVYLLDMLFSNRRKNRNRTNVFSFDVALVRNGVTIRGISGSIVRPKFGLRVVDNA